MNRIKITQPGWAGYTGPLGPVEFVEGVSVDPVDRNQADLIAAVVQTQLLDEDDNELGPAGSAHRLVTESRERAPVVPELPRQTAGEKNAENRREAGKRDEAPTVNFYTSKELEAVASADGIQGLRKIGHEWNVKHRAIPALIQLILKEQTGFLERRDQRMRSAGGTLEQEGGPPALLGSDKFEASYTIGEKTVSLGELVIAAAAEADVTPEVWNALTQEERDAKIQVELDTLVDLAAEPDEDPQAKDVEAADFVEGEPKAD